MPIKAKTQKKNIDKPKRNIGSDCVEECLRILFALTIDDNMPQFEVNFFMNDNIRQIELQNIVDKRLEVLDPKPDIQILFKEYDRRYFKGLLNQNNFEIVWSQRLNYSTGITYNKEDRNTADQRALPSLPVRIYLSRKQLTFCTRKQKVETILHEMIHAFTMVTDLPEYEDHGQYFLGIMEDLNKLTGAEITVFHDLDKCVDKKYEDYKEQHRMVCKKRRDHLLSIDLLEGK